jgi:hypothetical protein
MLKQAKLFSLRGEGCHFDGLLFMEVTSSRYVLLSSGHYPVLCRHTEWFSLHAIYLSLQYRAFLQLSLRDNLSLGGE